MQIVIKLNIPDGILTKEELVKKQLEFWDTNDKNISDIRKIEKLFV